MAKAKNKVRYAYSDTATVIVQNNDMPKGDIIRVADKTGKTVKILPGVKSVIPIHCYNALMSANMEVPIVDERGNIVYEDPETKTRVKFRKEPRFFINVIDDPYKPRVGPKTKKLQQMEAAQEEADEKKRKMDEEIAEKLKKEDEDYPVDYEDDDDGSGDL